MAEADAGVAGAMVDVAVWTGEGEVTGGFDGFPCCAEASAVEKITKAAGMKQEKDRRNMVIRK